MVLPSEMYLKVVIIVIEDIAKCFIVSRVLP